jgi:hypothetical protein
MISSRTQNQADMTLKCTIQCQLLQSSQPDAYSQKHNKKRHPQIQVTPGTILTMKKIPNTKFTKILTAPTPRQVNKQSNSRHRS